MTGQRAEVNEAKKSIHYMLEAALRYGGATSYVDLLDQVGRLRPYKPYNALLVLLQRPGSTAVKPAHHWEQQYGRVIKPGEQPLVMLQPNGPVMFLFDVSQTEALVGSRQLPVELQNPFEMADYPNVDLAWHWLTSNAKADGVRVSDTKRGLPSAGCIWRSHQGLTQSVESKRRPPTLVDVPIRYETLVNAAHSPTERLCTLAHELGHLYCGHIGTHDRELWPDRRALPNATTEIEAESVARVVFRRLSPELDLPPYLDRYLRNEDAAALVDVERVLSAAGRVIEMAYGWAPRRAKRGRPAMLAGSAD